MSILEAISPTARQVLATEPATAQPATGTQAEIDITRRKVLDLLTETREYLAAKPTAFLDELSHRSGDSRNSPFFSERAAAEIVHCACVLILERRMKSS